MGDFIEKQVCHMCVALAHSDSFHGHFVRFVAGIITINQFVSSVQQLSLIHILQKQEGVGIGLYLARQIISGEGGYIKVASVPGKGSTFRCV